MTATVHPTSASCGAEIRGVDLSRELDAESVATIRAAFRDHSVLVFRDQDIADRDQLRFCEAMGGVATRGKPKHLRTDADEEMYAGAVHLVTNLTEDGKPLGSFGDGEVWFHHDGSFREVPYAATVLYAVQLPSAGGETVIADMYAAYDRLPSATRARLDGLTALNIYDYARTGRVDLDQDISGINHWVHPVVIRHPESGRRALYVSPLITARIEGMDGADSDALLEELFAYIADDGLMYEHVWRVGDLVMMDNRSTTHARRDFPADEPRLLRRTMVEGVPIAA